MKIRSGFVSNSSSSSFIIVTKTPPTLSLLEKALCVDKFHPLYGVSKQIARYIYDNSEVFSSIQEVLDSPDMYYDDVSDISPLIQAALNDGKHVGLFRCSNEDCDPISALLYYGGDIGCKTEHLIIQDEW